MRESGRARKTKQTVDGFDIDARNVPYGFNTGESPSVHVGGKLP
jgi:hypothetical protein